jgi:hypothetical protein
MSGKLSCRDARKTRAAMEAFLFARRTILVCDPQQENAVQRE